MLELVIYAALCAAFADFLDDCLKPNMIFEKWGNFVEGKFWLKPFGGCIQCTNVWINIIVYMLMIPCISQIDFVMLFGQIGASNYLLKKWIL